MHQRSRSLSWPLRLLASVMAMGLPVGGVIPAVAQDGPIPAWAEQHAIPLSTVDPGAPLDDLAPLRRSVGDADIVALGESAHGAREELALKQRTLPCPVERMGFRSIA